MSTTTATLRAIEEDRAVAALLAIHPDVRWVGLLVGEATKASERTGLSRLVVLLAAGEQAAEFRDPGLTTDWVKGL